jgi:hypothetical protein
MTTLFTLELDLGSGRFQEMVLVRDVHFVLIASIRRSSYLKYICFCWATLNGAGNGTVIWNSISEKVLAQLHQRCYMLLTVTVKEY